MKRQPFACCHVYTLCQVKALLAYSERSLRSRTLLPGPLTSDESIESIFTSKGLVALHRADGRCARNTETSAEKSCGCESRPGWVGELAAVFVLYKQRAAVGPQDGATAAQQLLCQSRRRRVKAGESLFVPASSVPSRPDFHTACASLRNQASKTRPARGGTGTLCQISSSDECRIFVRGKTQREVARSNHATSAFLCGTSTIAGSPRGKATAS